MYKILVIENDVLLLEILGDWLILMGCLPLKANTAQEGYQLLETEDPDLILCSYRLADGNGLEFLQMIRQDFPNQNIPFILSTGAQIFSLEDDHLVYTPNQILKKPFCPKVLVETLNSYLPNTPNLNLLYSINQSGIPPQLSA